VPLWTSVPQKKKNERQKGGGNDIEMKQKAETMATGIRGRLKRGRAQHNGSHLSPLTAKVSGQHTMAK